MRFVPIKSAARQDIQMLHRMRSLMIKNRTALIDQIRGLLAESGILLHKSSTIIEEIGKGPEDILRERSI